MNTLVKLGKYVTVAVLFLCRLAISAEMQYEISGRVDTADFLDINKFYNQCEADSPYSNANEMTTAVLKISKDPAVRITLDSIEVSLKGEGINKTIEPDMNGNFSFSDLPQGEYSITAESKQEDVIPYQVSEPIKCSTTIKTETLKSKVILRFRPLPVTVQGRLVTSEGTPIENGKLIMRGPVEDEYKEPPYWITFSDQDGNFEFSGIPARMWDQAAGHLVNKSKRLSNDEQSLIRPDVAGYKMANDSEGIYLPMITENVLHWARRDIKFMNIDLASWGKPKLIERTDRVFPESKGNTIFLGDVVLKKE